MRPAQAKMATELIEQGVMAALYLAADNAGGWAIYNGDLRQAVLEVIDRLPLRKQVHGY